MHLISKGKTKNIYYVDDMHIDCEFTDNITAFNGKYADIIVDKGKYVNAISAHFMRLLSQCGVHNHFIEKVNDNTQRCVALQMIPVEVVIRNYAAGSFIKKHDFEYMDKLPASVYDIYCKNDAKNDPMVSLDVLDKIYQIPYSCIVDMIDIAFRANSVLQSYMYAKDLHLIDIKFEFGIDCDQNIVLGDEISNESSRIFDIETQKCVDKDVYRNTGDIQPMKDAFTFLGTRLDIF